MRPALPVTLAERLQAIYPASSRRALKRWLVSGRVRVNERVVRRGDVTVDPADRVELGAPPPPAFPAFLQRVWEDSDLLVVDKPPGLLTMATERERERTAYRALAGYVTGAPTARGEHRRLFIVHRLDRETSGLIVFAKSAAAKRLLQEQFKARTVERRYTALVEGRVREASGVLRDRLREDRALRVHPTRDPRAGREAITYYRVLQRRAETTLLELVLVTGRRGQIRAQLAALGHPIVGDVAYGSRRNPLRRVCLHATRLGFVDLRGRRVTFESPVPSAFHKS
ncbi:MAG: RNA pseudouridine synthase [Candidatus Rokubacteria bacterium]|nr:RNA pseudouridine synthase [Candidatus Rokubacteria bacterium]